MRAQLQREERGDAHADEEHAEDEDVEPDVAVRHAAARDDRLARLAKRLTG